MERMIFTLFVCACACSMFTISSAALGDACTEGGTECDGDVNSECASDVCACETGYSDVSGVCTDDDECTAGTDNCHADAVCTNTAGSFTCACNSGYTGDGVTCTVTATLGSACTVGGTECDSDVNSECANDVCACKTGFSDVSGVCTATLGSACTVGGTECDSDVNSECANDVCACKTGFSDVSGVCTDDDECTAGTDNCHADAVCTNTAGSFTCACNSGYTGDGVTCTVTAALGSACTVGGTECDSDVNSECANDVCACKTGFSDVSGVCTVVGNSAATTGLAVGVAWIALAFCFVQKLF